MSLRVFSFFLFPALVIDLFLIYTAVSEPHSTIFCSSSSFNCNNLTPILFPFSSLNSSCGVNLISCNGTVTKIRLFNSDFTVKRITYNDRTIEVRYSDSYETTLCSSPQNFSLSGKLLTSGFLLLGPNLTFFKCNSAKDLPLPPPWKREECVDGSLLYYYYSPQEQIQQPVDAHRINCPMYEIPAGIEESASANLSAILSSGFSLHWRFDCDKCKISGGQCVFGEGDAPACHCKDGSLHQRNCSDGSTSKLAGLPVKRTKIIIGVSAAAVGSLLLACFLFFIARSLWVSSARRPPAENGCLQLHTPAKVEKFLIDYETLTTTRYTYNDIKKMTNKFSYKLGQGGYGSVYKGWLSTGTSVAVKLIEKSYDDGEEFCNEVATIGRIHHVNVVRLLGFCAEGSRRALVYDFMEKGSLEKFTGTTNAGRWLLRERLYDIALGIARGIEYLHQGCDRRIIHFDIKPHNILLDHDFTPKISDFGLAKSYDKERNSVTITQGKGTIGYIAPELICGNSKHVSHKSDVYSFGMLLIAMIGMKEKIGPTDGASSDAYFPQ